MRLERKPIDPITKADIEALRAARRAATVQARTDWTAYDAGLVAYRAAQARQDHVEKPQPPAARRPGDRDGEVGTNRLLARLRHIFSWAIESGHVDRTPFKRAGQTVVRLEAAVEKGRSRRLDQGEDARLLAKAGPHLHALIVAALETAMPRGELLGLQWGHVQYDEQDKPRWITLPAELTKTNDARSIPVSQRLQAVLDMRRLDPDGQALPAGAHVFGNEVGEPVKSIKTAWKLTCRRAGIQNLHFHDLRQEFACRLLESPGVSGHQVRDWLGHTNITTTSQYLSTTPIHLQDALRKFENARAIRTPFAQNPERAAEAVEQAAPHSRPNTLN